ncbi:MAG: hypothetical protein K2O14_11605 [Oscillospiraceae bacterium]|nr:hypothetical protein [Oscillospiraceae bacterium]
MKHRFLSYFVAFLTALAFFSSPVTELLGGRYSAVYAAGASILEDYESKYYYSLLTEDQKAAYGLLFSAVKNSESGMDISEYKLNDDTLGMVMTLLKYENPQLFNTDGSATGTGNPTTHNWLTVNPNYTRTAAQVRNIRSQIEEAAAPIIEDALKESDVFKQVKVLHDAIVNMTTYTLNGPVYKSEADGPLVNGRALCEGYSKAFAYLCQSIGVQCICVVGSGNGENHMWNMVRIGDKWYHVDVTWDDPVGSQPVLRHDYFCVSTATIRKDHSISNPVAIPKADTDYDESMSEVTDTPAKPAEPTEPAKPSEPQKPAEPDIPEVPEVEPVLSESVPIDMRFSWLADPNSNISIVNPQFYYTNRIPQDILRLVGGSMGAGFDIGNINMRAQLIYNVGTADSGSFVTLLRYNESRNKAEYVSYGRVDESGNAALDVYGAGRYFVVIDRTAKIPGDISGNQAVNAMDAALLLRYLTNNLTIDTFIGDFNGDGRVNAIDAAAILAYSVA